MVDSFLNYYRRNVVTLLTLFELVTWTGVIHELSTCDNDRLPNVRNSNETGRTETPEPIRRKEETRKG